MYKVFIKPILFLFNPEGVHHFVMRCLKVVFAVPGVKAITQSSHTVGTPQLQRTVFDINFPNPVGLAAGFDKDAKLYNQLAAFGFGFIEIGTVTPLPQPGNPRPRMFRLPKDRALINRMGFNNDGVAAAVERLKKRNTNIVIGANIGKNKVTPNEQAISDYEKCFEALYPYADYFVVNVSSPNTPNLRELQDKEPLTKLLNHLMQLNEAKTSPKPLLLKIAPDLTDEQLQDIVEITEDTGINGIVATNTTISRENLLTEKEKVEAMGNGGVSGKPVTKRSTEVISYLRRQLGENFPIIGVGGIHSPEDALEKLKAGATLVQVYTGFIYEGPSLVKRINKAIANG